MSTLAHPSPIQRRRDLDFLRVAAMFAVIVIHCVMPITILLAPPNPDWAVAEVIDSYMRWAVPIFVMISGALLIRKETYTQIGSYFRRRAARIFIPLIAWPILYAFWLIALGNQYVTLPNVWDGIVAGDPMGASHFYFLFIIAGLYVLAPLISLYASRVSTRLFFITSVTILLATSTWHAIVNTIPGLHESLFSLTWCLPFIGYFMIGHSLRDLRPTRAQTIAALVGFIIFGLISALLTVVTRLDGNFFFQSYFSLTVIGLGICAFIGGKALYYGLSDSLRTAGYRTELSSTLTTLSAASFGVYLIHVMILDTIVAVLGLDKADLSTAAFLFIVVPPLSIAIVLGMMRLPYIRRLVT